MARARNIKPGFFKNETLASLSPYARLLFAGLWTIADRAGRLEDRPQRIKLEVLGYDDCDADQLLQSLHDKGFILRYKVGGESYIQILAWTKHQNPHLKEVVSTIQAPTPHQISLGKTGTSTVLAPNQHSSSAGNSGASPSLTLIPSSLNPLTLNPESDAADSFDFETWFAARWAKHPNKNYKNQARSTLGAHPQIFDATWRLQFEASQDAWANTEAWKWNHGAKCPCLYQWVNDEGYQFMPESPPGFGVGSANGAKKPSLEDQIRAHREVKKRILEGSHDAR